MSTKKKLPTHIKGSGNIFADLGLPNAEEYQLKATLLVQIKRLIAERELTQTEAAKLIKMKQPTCRSSCVATSNLYLWKGSC